MGGHGWGTDIVEADLLDSVRTALDIGVNFFDTADVYGLGKSEELLGKALFGNRQNAVIATKFGVRYENGKSMYDNSPDWITYSLEGSLKRLGTEYIDLYQIHYRDNTPLDEVIRCLEKHKESGKIRYIGITNLKSVDEIKGYEKYFVSTQNEYSLSNRSNEQLLRALYTDYLLSPLTWGSLGQGVLSGKYDKNTVFSEKDRRSRPIYVNFHGQKFEKNLRIVSELRNITEKYGVPIPAVAIRWILDNLQGSIVLVGIKHPNQIIENVKAFDWFLSRDELNLLDHLSR
jgi:aryl-alcohol dehydrogenase-like predicted oxidoreductase